MPKYDDYLNGRPLPHDYREALPIIEERYKILGRFMADISQRLCDLSNRTEQRFDRMEKVLLKTVELQELHALRVEKIEEILPDVRDELVAVRGGYAHLHSMFQNTNAKYAAHLAYTGQLYQQHEARQESRDATQARIDQNLELIAKVESREDKYRYAWRLAILGLMLISCALWVVEKIQIG